MDRRPKEQDVTYFLSFCIEQYKAKHHMRGGEVVALFDRHGLLPYLEEHFDVLHTQGASWLVTEIEEFMKEQEGGKGV